MQPQQLHARDLPKPGVFQLHAAVVFEQLQRVKVCLSFLTEI